MTQWTRRQEAAEGAALAAIRKATGQEAAEGKTAEETTSAAVAGQEAATQKAGEGGAAAIPTGAQHLPILRTSPFNNPVSSMTSAPLNSRNILLNTADAVETVRQKINLSSRPGMQFIYEKSTKKSTFLDKAQGTRPSGTQSKVEGTWTKEEKDFQERKSAFKARQFQGFPQLNNSEAIILITDWD